MNIPMYARVSLSEKYSNTMEIRGEIRGRNVEEYVFNSLPTQYFCVSSVNEWTANDVLEKINPVTIYIDEYILGKFSYNFYLKYKDKIVVIKGG